MLNPTFGLPCSWKRMMTLLNLLILAHAEKLRLLETQTWGTSNRERSYSLKGKGTTDAMFHLFGHPNPLFFLQYQMADNSPQQTRSPVWFLEHMNYKIQFVRFSGHRWLNYVVIQESCNDQILEVRMRDISVSVSTVMLSFACLSANCW